MAEVGELNVRLTAKGSDLASEVAAAKRQLDALGESGKNAGQQIASAFSSAAQSLDRSGILSGLARGFGPAAAIGASTTAIGAYANFVTERDQFGADQLMASATADRGAIAQLRMSQAQQQLEAIKAKYAGEFADIEKKLKERTSTYRQVVDAVATGAMFSNLVPKQTFREWHSSYNSDIDALRQRQALTEDKQAGEQRLVLDRLVKAQQLDAARTTMEGAAAVKLIEAQGTGDALDTLTAGTTARVWELRQRVAERERDRLEAVQGSQSAEAARLQDEVHWLQARIDAEEKLYQILFRRIQATRDLYELQFNINSASNQIGAAFGNISFASEGAIGNVAPYLTQFAIAMSGKGG